MVVENPDKKTNNNCLSLIRLIAALQVILGHLLIHFQLPGNVYLNKAIYFFRGVPIFFAISGYLIWFSIIRSKNYSQYIKKRFLRIYPELWVAVIIEIVVLMVLYNGWKLKDIILFAIGQGTIFQFWTPDSLRGYGVGTPNGALWTIGVMIQFYIVAWIFFKLLRKRKIFTWIIGFAISFVISLLGEYLFTNVIKIELLAKLYDQTFIKYLWLFYIGMFFANFNDLVLPVLKKFWYLFLLAAVFFFISGWDLFSGYYLFWSLFLVSGLIGFAYRFPKFNIKYDISYGLFLYHMTVVNVFVSFSLTGKWLYIIPVILISAVLALLSTITIGKITSKLKFKVVND